MFPRSAWWRITADDELLLVHALEFDPGAAPPARFINEIPALPKNPPQAAAFNFREQGLRVPANFARETNWLAGIGAKLFEKFFPLLQGQRDQTFAFELK